MVLRQCRVVRLRVSILVDLAVPPLLPLCPVAAVAAAMELCLLLFPWDALVLAMRQVLVPLWWVVVVPAAPLFRQFPAVPLLLPSLVEEERW